MSESRPSKVATIVGWILGILPCLLLIFSATMKFVQPASMQEGLDHLGWPMRLMIYLGIVELGCTILYLIPKTAVLGAVLFTGYLGGATATHTRVGDPWFGPVLFGVVLWLGLYLRDRRIRALLPLR